MTLRTDWDPVDFGAFSRPLGLRHFAARELLTKTGRRGNAPPPKALWRNIVPTVLVLDRLRAAIGAPIVILSGYRAPDYNRAVGGSRRSQHLAFTAADIACVGAEPEELHALLRRWRGAWFDSPVALDGRRPADTPSGPTPFRPLETRRHGAGCRFRWTGGLGLYDTFLHLDSRGAPADWDLRR